jgi:hypothetical protein
MDAVPPDRSTTIVASGGLTRTSFKPGQNPRSQTGVSTRSYGRGIHLASIIYWIKHLFTLGLDCKQFLPTFETMPSHSRWAAIVLGIAGLFNGLTSHHALKMSYTLTTATGIFFFALLYWILYTLILYPRYFSPFRHLPTPKVNKPSYGV